MFNLFKKKPKEPALPQLLDLNGEPLAIGDKVISKRYDLGKCTIQLEGREFFYHSTEKKDLKISYLKMIDAITGNQKVVKEEK